MTLIDKAIFSLTMNLVALRIPARKCATFMQRLHGHVLHKPKIRPILKDEFGDESGRLLLLSEDISDLQLSGLPSELRDFVQAEGAEAVPHSVDIGYDFYNAEQARA